jgi:hypothetical protein
MSKTSFHFIALSVFIFVSSSLYSQTDTIPTYAEFMPIPMMRSCETAADTNWTDDSLRNCALQALNQLIAQEMHYPDAALRDSIQGRAIVSFIIDTTGTMRDYTIVKDPGGGCGAEAVRIFQDMSNAGLRWVPANNDGKRTPIKVLWPIKFQIKTYTAPVSYKNDLGLDVYTEPDSLAYFMEGEEALLSYLTNQMVYPASEKKSCKVGIIEASLLVLPNAQVQIEQLIDFSSLGFEFQWEATKMLNKSSGKWQPALYQNKPVASNTPVRILFKSDDATCAIANASFDQSVLKFADGLVAYDANDLPKAIDAFTAALQLQPNNTEYLYYRATAHASSGDTKAACADYTAIKELLGSVWFKQIFRLLCNG